MDDRLWTPPSAKVKPTEMKKEGGSHFDDEVMDLAMEKAQFAIEVERLIDHLRKRPDHRVYVSSTEERTKMRSVFNLWFQNGTLDYHPDIRIEYGVPDGQIRIAE